MPRRNLAVARILLTGASSGIGRELALALARRGARLLLAARRDELLCELTDECAHLGRTCDFIAGDVTDPSVRAALLSRAAELWGGLDVLVNNAGVSAHGSFVDSNEATLRQIMEVNFFAAAELTRGAIPLLRVTAKGAGVGLGPAILNIGSIIGHRGLPLNSEYAASKFALRGWSESLRAELAIEGIDVLLVSPGTTATEFFDHLVAKRARLPWGNSQSIPPAAVAELAVRALECNRREIFPNWRGRAMVMANRFAPGFVDRIVKRMMRGLPRE